MRFHWFGDSWVSGDELITPHLHRFSQLVSDAFGAECVNLGRNGSNINALPLIFHQHLPNIDPDDIVFFCLTASSRTGMFDHSGQFKNILTMSYPGHSPHPHSEKWFKYFDSPCQRVYNYDNVINLLWLWCKYLKIKCYFLNLFTSESHSIIDCVPSDAWLVPRDQCIAQSIMSYIDNEYGAVIADDNPNLTDQQWQEQRMLIEKYIKPNYAHPNIQGHAKIAQDLTILLNERFRISKTDIRP
jgi:hypothetical protein